MSVKQKALTLQDRKVLAERWSNGDSAVVIAVEMGFSPSAIYAELRRGDTGELDENKRPRYDPELGQTVYQQNLRSRGNRGRRQAAQN